MYEFARLLQTMTKQRADKYKPQLWLIWKALQGTIDSFKVNALRFTDKLINHIISLI